MYAGRLSDGHLNALVRRLTRWPCTDECKYAYMHAVTDLALESSVRVEQLYGKWLFWRLAASRRHAGAHLGRVSIVNLLMHVLGANWLRRGVHPAHPMRSFYLTWSYMSVNVWVWSAVFHTCGAFASSISPLPFRVLTSPDLEVPFYLPPTSCGCSSQPESRPSRLATFVPTARALSPSGSSNYPNHNPWNNASTLSTVAPPPLPPRPRHPLPSHSHSHSLSHW